MSKSSLNIETRKSAGASDDAGSPKPDKKARAATKHSRRKNPKATKTSRKKAPAKKPRAGRENTKQSRLIEMLKRSQGASVGEIVKSLDWQPHTVRGAIAGALKKKLGLDVTSEKEEKRGRIYRIQG